MATAKLELQACCCRILRTRMNCAPRCARRKSLGGVPAWPSIFHRAGQHCAAAPVVNFEQRLRSSVDRALASGARSRRFKSCRGHSPLFLTRSLLCGDACAACERPTQINQRYGARVRTGTSVSFTTGLGASCVATMLPGGLGKLHTTRRRPLSWRTCRQSARPLATSGVGVAVTVPAAAIKKISLDAAATPVTINWLLKHTHSASPAIAACLLRNALSFQIRLSTALLF